VKLDRVERRKQEQKLEKALAKARAQRARAAARVAARKAAGLPTPKGRPKKKEKSSDKREGEGDGEDNGEGEDSMTKDEDNNNDEGSEEEEEEDDEDESEEEEEEEEEEVSEEEEEEDEDEDEEEESSSEEEEDDDEELAPEDKTWCHAGCASQLAELRFDPKVGTSTCVCVLGWGNESKHGNLESIKTSRLPQFFLLLTLKLQRFIFSMSLLLSGYMYMSQVERVVLAGRANGHRMKLRCTVCRQSGRFDTVQCAQKRCSNAFHVRCAVPRNLALERGDEQWPRLYSEDKPYCAQHWSFASPPAHVPITSDDEGAQGSGDQVAASSSSSSSSLSSSSSSSTHQLAEVDDDDD